MTDIMIDVIVFQIRAELLSLFSFISFLDFLFRNPVFSGVPFPGICFQIPFPGIRFSGYRILKSVSGILFLRFRLLFRNYHAV